MAGTTGHKQKNYIKAVILAAGKGKRWNNYLGRPKQMVMIDNEPLLLRTIRQLKERGFGVVVTVPEIDFFGKLDAEQIVGVDEVEIDKFLNAKDYIGSIFFWGDTYFTDEAMDIITKSKADFMFFGRRGGSKITGKKWGEIFAVKTNNMLFEKAKELRKMSTMLKRCATWELYRLICGYPLDRHQVGDNFTEIDDLTDDFDYPHDYDNWLKKYEKSKRYHRKGLLSY